MTEQGEIMGIFTTLISKQRSVTLYNTYRGVPFSYEAEILAADEGNVAARVHRYQAVSMALEGRTYIHTSVLPEIIRANVVEVDFRKKQAILDEFTPVGDHVGKRIGVRVQPGGVVADRAGHRDTLVDLSDEPVLGPQAVGEFFARQPAIPQVSVGVKVSGIPSITADGSTGRISPT